MIVSTLFCACKYEESFHTYYHTDSAWVSETHSLSSLSTQCIHDNYSFQQAALLNTLTKHPSPQSSHPHTDAPLINNLLLNPSVLATRGHLHQGLAATWACAAALPSPATASLGVPRVEAASQGKAVLQKAREINYTLSSCLMLSSVKVFKQRR